MRPAVLAAFLVLAAPAVAHAQQVFESVGSRALGMGGAFVAVANDSSAVFWNPAGLALAGPVGATIEWVHLQSGNPRGPLTPGPARRSGSLVSLGTWPMGLSYTKLQTTALVAGPSGSTTAAVFQTTQAGVTILQSLVRGVVLGSTLKYVRGTVRLEGAQGPAVEDAFDHADRLRTGKTTGRFDYDLGLIIDMEQVRIGVTTRNLRSPTFPDLAGNATVLRRQSRLGVAVLPSDGLTLAMDVDLDTVDLRDGLRRMIAFGGEERLGSRFVLRGGVRWNLLGEKRQEVVAVGASFALRPRYWLDGHVTRGRIDGDRGFGLALRAGY